jgi:hypothetical protein
MTQNSFCTKCHRIPSQCVCGGTFRELTDEEIMVLYEEYIETHYISELNVLGFGRAILKKAMEK